MNRIACSPAAAPLDSRGAAPAALAMGVRARNASHYLGNDEPPLDELLADDDVLRRVMARDGVRPESLRALAGFVRS